MKDMNDFECYLKEITRRKVVDEDKQDEKYFETLWNLWWGWMDSNIKDALLELFKKDSKFLFTEEDMKTAITLAREGCVTNERYDSDVTFIPAHKPEDIISEIKEKEA